MSAPGFARVGVGVRTDVDLEGDGATTLIAASLHFYDRVDVHAGAMLGGTHGAFGALRVALRGGSVRPILMLGAPVYFAEATVVGVHAAAGLEVPIGAFAVHVDVGVQRLVLPLSYAQTFPVGTAGVIWRP